MITQNLPCPGCGYNLRGLTGDLVICPECGRSCDVLALIKEKQSERAWATFQGKPPGYDPAVLPAMLLLLSPAPAGYLAAAALAFFLIVIWPAFEASDPAFVATALITVVTAFTWVWLLYRVWRRWPGRRGLFLSLLGHAVLVGSVAVPLFGIICAVIWIVAGSMDNLAVCAMGAGVILVAVLIGVGVLQGERYMQRQCVRRHQRGCG